MDRVEKLEWYIEVYYLALCTFEHSHQDHPTGGDWLDRVPNERILEITKDACDSLAYIYRNAKEDIGLKTDGRGGCEWKVNTIIST